VGLPQVRDAEVTATAAGVPLLDEVRAGVHLSVLESTRDGDVFYVVCQPGIVYRKNLAAASGEFEFQAVGTDQWFSLEQLGALRERVVVLHNARTACAPAAGPLACRARDTRAELPAAETSAQRQQEPGKRSPGGGGIPS
jgi:hypothetical protein